MKRLFNCLAILLVVPLVGCKTLSTTTTSKPVAAAAKPVKQASFNPIEKIGGKKPKMGNPDSIVAIWKDATYTVAGQQPTRGFGGRLYFQDRAKNPIVVDGELVVYGFSDDRYDPDRKPEKRFVFTREDLPHHLSMSAAGPSYSIWLPYDHINGEQKNITLIAVFKDARAGGRVSKSEAIPAVLPGTRKSIDQAAFNLKEEILKREAELQNLQKVGFDANAPQGSRKVKSHEIKIPSGARERLFGAVPVDSYRLPEPSVTISTPGMPPQNGASLVKTRTAAQADQSPTVNSASLQSSTGFSPDQLRAQTGRFERQGRLPPGKQLPRPGAMSDPE